MAKTEIAESQPSTTDAEKAKKKLKHLEWAIERRYQNQQCSLRLLVLFDIYSSKWQTKDYSKAAQDLVAVSFSLWRAAFLAEKEGTRKKVFASGRGFLHQIVENNAIAYSHDITANEWTFNYYTRNARAALQNLARFWEDLVPKYVGGARKATDRWDYCHKLLETAVTNFESHLRQKQAEAEQASQRASSRKRRKENRRKVRAITFEERKKAAAGL